MIILTSTGPVSKLIDSPLPTGRFPLFEVAPPVQMVIEWEGGMWLSALFWNYRSANCVLLA